MNEKTFSALYAALTELNDAAALEELQSIKEQADSGNFFVAFIGQYSAGKSSLINNLLGRQLLPGGRVETTPILTYISYGEQEGGRLFYLDGNTEDIDIETVSDITQTNRAARNLDEIEHLEIFLNEPILADGMILLDTPGINTLIRRHEQLLANSLSLASAIIYVVSGAPSRVDIEKLQDFAEHGFPLSFVRTHCDEINEWEETYRQVVNSDEKVLRDCNLTNALEQCFFVSNVEGSKYFGEIEKIRALLRVKGKDAHGELERGAAARFEVIAKRAIAELKELQSTLGQKKSERESTLENQRKKIDAEIARLHGVLQKRRQKLKTEVETCQASLKKDLEQYALSSGDKAAKIIKAAGEDVKTNSDMEDYARRKIRPILNHAFEIINLQISPILKDINGGLQVGGELKIAGADAMIEDLPELESYSDVMNYQDAELEELRRNLVALQKNREDLQIQLSTSNDTELQNELMELERELAALKNEREGLGTYKEKMVLVDAGDNSGAKIGKTVGNVLDWVTILLPQGAVTKAAKGAGLLSKISSPMKIFKTAKVFLFGEKISRTASIINKSKKFLMEAAKVAGKAKATVDMAKEVAPPSILDYLTLEHWGEKLGSQFDSPPRYEEDLVYRREFFENKRQIEQNILKKQQELFRRKEAMHLFKNEQERKAERLASLDVDEQDLNRQLKGLESKMRQDAKKKAREDWKNQWAEYYREALPKFLIAQAEQYLADLPERLESYQANRFSALEEKLSEKKAEYNSLADMREDDVAKKFQRTENILRQLESAGCR
ncbi:MAG: dynamin family protein [Selenomonadaceae bacterium]|nr:dynamin family protein [Selenomonadaceae bacterium]